MLRNWWATHQIGEIESQLVKISHGEEAAVQGAVLRPDPGTTAAETRSQVKRTDVGTLGRKQEVVEAKVVSFTIFMEVLLGFRICKVK